MTSEADIRWAWFNMGVEQENRRIIALVNELKHSDNDKPCCDHDESLFQLIELIKGENE